MDRTCYDVLEYTLNLIRVPQSTYHPSLCPQTLSGAQPLSFVF